MTLLLRPRECSLRQRRQRSNCWKQHLAEKCILQQCIGLFAAVFTCPCFLIGAGGYPKSGRAKTKCSCCSCFAGRVVDSTRSTFLAFWPRRPKRANMVWRSKHGEVNSLCCSVGLFVTARIQEFVYQTCRVIAWGHGEQSGTGTMSNKATYCTGQESRSLSTYLLLESVFNTLRRGIKVFLCLAFSILQGHF